MSQRTIVEFNHDFGHRINDDPNGFISLIMEVIRGGVTENTCETRRALRRFGVSTTPTHHHSCKATLTLETERGHQYHNEIF